MSEGNRGAFNDGAVGVNERLFGALADYIRVPLVNIARSAEIQERAGPKQVLAGIETTAESALRLIDSYLLAQKMNQGRLQLELEPTTVSKVLYDSAHKLDKMAKAYNCQLRVDNSKSLRPVMAHRPSLEAALTSLGHVFIEASGNEDKQTDLTFASHGARKGMVAGVFANIDGLSGQMYSQAKLLYGLAKMPISNLTPDSGVGVFVADVLLSAMSARLRIARHGRLNGLAATLSPSYQLSLI